MSAGELPDLKRSGMLPDAESWKQVVIGGALASRGMASFAKYLTPEEAEAIRAYVATTAQDLDQVAAMIRSRGGSLAQEPGDLAWGGRAFALTDPDGYAWTMIQA